MWYWLHRIRRRFYLTRAEKRAARRIINLLNERNEILDEIVPDEDIGIRTALPQAKWRDLYR